MNVLICIPTYNEAENIRLLIPAIFKNSPENTHVLIVDDNSPDGTATVVKTFMAGDPARIYLMERPGKQGGASAFLEGFAWALEHGYDAVLAMDADFSHRPEHIAELIAAAARADCVFGSRLVKGGSTENRSAVRNVISHGASWYCRLALDVSIHDWTGGYNLWTASALRKIGLDTIFTRGYSFQMEMKYKAVRAGCATKEIPIAFPDRISGVSKMPTSYFTRALVDVWRIKFSLLRSPLLKTAIKFAIAGGLGTLTNLALFFLCVDVAHLPATPVSVGCFAIAGTQNYITHHKWSFASDTKGTKPSLKAWLLFLCSSLLGLAANIAVMNLILMNLVVPVKTAAGAAGIAAGLSINFFMSKFVVFRKKSGGA
ncbi:MAG: glycosyltransferase family 2 protein [Spirochaetaceae bacterium]|nr:glycosyltransferase family 2 protein [Spirochaetaceae bacterium]